MKEQYNCGLCSKTFSYVSSFKKHLRKSHSEILVEDIEDNKWQNYCRITKNPQGIEGHYKSHDSSLASNVFFLEDSSTNNKANLASTNGKVGSAAASLKLKENKINELSIHSMEGSLIEPTKRKRRNKDKRSNNKFAIINGREDTLNNLPGSSVNAKQQEDTMKQSLKATAPISSIQDIRNPINYKGTIPSNVPMNEVDKSQSIRLENNTPKSVIGVNRNKFVIERLDNQSSSKEALDVKQNSLPVSISEDFTKRLEKAQINTNKVISIIQPSKTSNQITKNPNTLPTRSTSYVKFNHVHNEYCGHIRVIHNEHIDYLVNGELHYIDASGRVYPHKLEVSEVNPIGCRLKLKGNFANAEEYVTEHVRFEMI